MMSNIYDEDVISANVLSTLGSQTFLCMLGTRMFFNLKEAAEHGVNEGTNYQSHTVTSMQFKQPGAVNDDTYELYFFAWDVWTHEIIRILSPAEPMVKAEAISSRQSTEQLDSS
jgi:hypothetical protein